MDKDGQAELSQRAKERSNIYSLLSVVYRKEPSQELLKSFKESDYLRLLKEAGVELDKYFDKKPLQELAEELAVEYTRLFIGPGKHIYPYESAYRDEKVSMMSDSALRIKNLIESYGLRYPSDFLDNFDHISVELEFMEKITYAESNAWKRKNFPRAIEALELERRFLDEHLLRWVPAFTEKVIGAARLDFYKEIAKLTKEYVLSESRAIKGLIRQANGISKSEVIKNV